MTQDIPIEKCYGETLVLDLRNKCRENYPITIADLEEAEKKTEDKVRQGDIVIIHTGWAARWAYGPRPNRGKYPGPGLFLLAFLSRWKDLRVSPFGQSPLSPTKKEKKEDETSRK